ncbi:MAG: aminotransferase class IV [Deltaproteobacteria bacterium]|nr:aminotransferase class IV [Deltaproteobacteria bacterium]
MSKVYINGQLVSETAAKLSVFDRGFLYGEGVFETLRAYAGRVAFPALHYHRLRENCERLQIDLPLDEYAFEKTVQKVLAANRLREAVVRVTISAGGTAYTFDRPPHLDANVVLFARRFRPKPERLYHQGASIIVVTSVCGEPPALANLKTTSYLCRMLARQEVQAARADEGLLLNQRGWVLEGTATNLLLVRKGRLYTPPLSDGVLPGVTRFGILGVADSLDIPWREAHISIENLKAADEIFLTGTTSEVLPVREIRDITIKPRTPGPITRQLMAAYQQLLPH